jgi:FkbM family methyltransferase
MDIRGRFLWMPLSHDLPFCAKPDGNYDKLLRRISDFIRGTEGRLCGIDVGANIGDTIVACANDNKDRFLALEPDPVFFQYLKKNLADLPQCRLLQMVCDSEDRATAYRISSVGGTARFKKTTAGGPAIHTKRVDTILGQFPEFQQCNFLKIDADGYDFEVIRGAQGMIATAQPTVLFECDVFGNPNFVADTFETLRFFSKTGYRHALVYDHLGFLFAHHELDKIEDFSQALFFQTTSQHCYFDILVMRDAGKFLRQELDYFVHSTPDPERRSAAGQAAKIILAQLDQD